MDPRLTTRQAHQRYPHIPEATFRYWRYSGVGPPTVKIRSRVFYVQSQLDAWLTEQEQMTGRGGAA